MEVPLYLADAFITDCFRGNPAAVCVLENPAPEPWMQAVANEMNQAETAFVHPATNGDWSLRWFTPTREVELCGHATLASAHVLATTNRASLPITFHTLSGPLTVSATQTGYQMDFPAWPTPEHINIAEIEDVLQTKLVEAWANDNVYLAELESEEAIQHHRPDFNRILTLGRVGIIITARGAEADFVSRFYAPNFGVPEDHVTGSAHCSLAMYWSERLGKTKMVGHQLSPRGGEVGVELTGDRVLLTGQARTFLSGTIQQ
ncbi:MAG: PhzF family phenazine biosynthesis protein [Chthonomonas sp.]|nr:PhzF family phenazine biosynthesis protein [Chthonomonas sp.]